MGDFEGSSRSSSMGVIFRTISKFVTEFLSNGLKPSPNFFKILSHCLAKFCDGEDLKFVAATRWNGGKEISEDVCVLGGDVTPSADKKKGGPLGYIKIAEIWCKIWFMIGS